MAARQDPLRNFRYRLEIDQIQQAGFAEVAIGDLSNEPIEYREGDVKPHRSEDLYFCDRVRAADGKIVADFRFSAHHRGRTPVHFTEVLPQSGEPAPSAGLPHAGDAAAAAAEAAAE